MNRPKTHREVQSAVETAEVRSLRERSEGYSADCSDGSRCKGGTSSTWALMRNAGNLICEGAAGIDGKSIEMFEANLKDVGYLKHMSVAPGHIFLGTDYPYQIMQTKPADFISNAGLSAEALLSMQSRAACYRFSLLRLPDRLRRNP